MLGEDVPTEIARIVAPAPATIVHPEHKRDMPLDLEPITRLDSNTKNDCRRDVAKRLLNSIRLQYPDRQLVVLEDALAAIGPHIEGLMRHKLDFIIGARIAERKHRRSVRHWQNSASARNHKSGVLFDRLTAGEYLYAVSMADALPNPSQKTPGRKPAVLKNRLPLMAIYRRNS